MSILIPTILALTKGKKYQFLIQTTDSLTPETVYTTTAPNV